MSKRTLSTRSSELGNMDKWILTNLRTCCQQLTSCVVSVAPWPKENMVHLANECFHLLHLSGECTCLILSITVLQSFRLNV
jgi:hypothetical protein